MIPFQISILDHLTGVYEGLGTWHKSINGIGKHKGIY